MQHRLGGLLYGPEEHHLDHLAPLCSLLGIPLIVTDDEIEALARKYYPQLDIQLRNYIEVGENLLQSFDAVICSIPRDIFDEAFFIPQKLRGKKIHTVWCPHGNSDKGFSAPLMEGLLKEEVALVYGQKMIDFFIQKGIYARLKAHVITGNYRLEYFKRNRDFYKTATEVGIFRKLKPGLKTLLYAPTWQDYEGSSSFFQAAPSLIKMPPENWNLIIKIHPNMLVQSEREIANFIENISDHPRIQVITHFPPIYPLLAQVDAYLGDMSSIGYDFLSFDKPMFFLNPNDRDQSSDQGLFLYRCGREIKKNEMGDIFSIITNEGQEELSKIRQEVYKYTFAQDLSWKKVETSLSDALRDITEDELPFY